MKHWKLPLHWIEEWQINHFWVTTLKQLGATYQLGHTPGKACLFPKNAHVDFTVIHTNGIHNVAARFCGCQGPSHINVVQLLQACWFPSTPSDPHTCTTFPCLCLFHHLNCLAKIQAAFLLTMVQWRLLKTCKWRGRAHNQTGVQGTAQGELAVECPACPHPGWNLPPNWKEYPKELQFLFYMFLAIDANFRLKNKIVLNEIKNPLLSDGWAYFVRKMEYMEHLKRYVNQTEISSCSGFAAMFLANLKNVKGLQTSGVAGICCARHGLWQKNGMGDLQVGERFCNIDFVFTKTIEGEEWICIIISYDISCQWLVNFWTRMEEIDPNICIHYNEDNIIFMIPKFHVKAHQEVNHQKFCFDYQPGVGKTHVETVEEGWASSNKAASQTKEMSAASRALTLDDIFGFFNWQLAQSLDRVLAKRLIRAVKEFKIHDHNFAEFSESLRESVGDNTIGWWDKMIEEWDKDKTKPCPYELPGDGIFPSEKMSLKEVEIELAKEEHKALARGVNVHSSSSCVRSRALKIKTTPHPTPTQMLEFQCEASTLLRNIQSFRDFQSLLMPTLRDYLNESQKESFDKPDADNPENIKLFLPSDFRSSARNGVCAQVCDSLKRLRQGLRARTMTSEFKLKNITGQVRNTRTQGVYKNKLSYWHPQSAILSLKGHGEWEKELKVLEDDDVWGLSEQALSQEERAQEEARRERGFIDEVAQGNTTQLPSMGESHRTFSWIWYNQAVSSSDASFEDAVRVEYAKAKARADRWEEEVLLLVEEL
ncbi:hypothetical protein BT96DRAFT_959877 [Gymnopus androsaceus JB14]|uniref:CxC2-like cysteine cluster KDZ transposase-associated domain-containing protein n=1 Tax=Gymnopus androsaceus JB14 TaxID=1447944 RepID=A0A6A4GYE1_9AGAR|nr:hypothetical protein BT96DRAFT_959877 [Gymnopus androsaceus JB14]